MHNYKEFYVSTRFSTLLQLSSGRKEKETEEMLRKTFFRCMLLSNKNIFTDELNNGEIKREREKRKKLSVCKTTSLSLSLSLSLSSFILSFSHLQLRFSAPLVNKLPLVPLLASDASNSFFLGSHKKHLLT